MATLLAFAIGGACAASANAQSPVWTISSSSSPTNFAPGDETGDDKYVLSVVDTGGGSDAGSPIEVSDTLPTGVTASAVSGEDLGNGHPLSCSHTPEPSCSYEGFEMASGDVLRIEVTVKVSAGVAASVTNMASVSGGGARAIAQAEDPTTVSSNEAGFGIASFATTWSNTQAGAAVNLTAGFTFNQVESGGKTYPAADDKEVTLNLPPGFVANPQAVPWCTTSEVVADSCPSSAAVGVVFISRASGGSGTPVQYSSLVYNTAPVPGQFGTLTFYLSGSPVWLDLVLRPNGAVGVAAKALPTVGLISMTLTLWGTPAAYSGGTGPDHVQASGEPAFGEPGASPSPTRFVTSAGSCGATPSSALSAESWEAPGTRLEATFPTPSLTGCNRLPFSPSLDVSSDINEANTPSGYDIDVHLPQPQEPGLASAELNSATIALPQGADISLPSANGLLVCGEAEIALGSPAQDMCPEASTIGTAEIETPLVGRPLQGHLYIAKPGENPLHSQLALYVVADESLTDTSIKLAGRIEFNPIAERFEIVFEELPQLPIGGMDLHFFGGPRAFLSTPPTCGTATSTAELEPWSEASVVTASSSFKIESGVQGTSCSAPHPFSPTFVTEATAAGAADTFNSLALLVSRTNHDEEQELGRVAIEAPASLAQMFAGAQACEKEPHASEGLCSAASKVGQVGATVGLGSHPVAVGGPIYLAGPYDGSAQSLSIVLPIDPGPFEFGTEVVRAAIGVNPSTGALTLTSGPIPTVANGLPLHLDELLLLFDRGTFTVNPACESLAVTAAITSIESGSVRIESDPLGASTPPCPSPAEPGPPTQATQAEHGLPTNATQAGASVSLLSTDIATNGRGVATIKLACEAPPPVAAA